MVLDDRQAARCDAQTAMQTKGPARSCQHAGPQFWQRPTLARPVAVLPSGLQRFTSVFGMGTGGSTALWSPEIWADVSTQISGEVTG